MKNSDCTHGDTFTDEVKVDFHVLGALMLNGVGGEVAGADIVAVDEACGVQGMVKFLEQLPQPSGFSDAVGNSPVLYLGAGPRDSGLPLGGPGDQAAPEEDGVAGGGAAGVRAAGPISVGVDTELCWGCSGNDQTMAEGALKIAKDPLGSDKVSFPRIMHMKAHLLDGIGNVGPGEGEVLEGTHKAAISSGISNRRAGISWYLCTSVNWSGARLAVTHAMASKYVQSVLTL